MKPIAKTCPHVGEHPSNFQCACCEDTADDCNCNYCAMVFCEKCQAVVMISPDEIREAWYESTNSKSLRIDEK